MNYFYSQFKSDYVQGQEIAKQKIEENYEKHKLPNNSYNWIMFKCFDSCVKNFNNKSIDKIEGDCVDSCTKHLLYAPGVF